jgi:hypothetical protein
MCFLAGGIMKNYMLIIILFFLSCVVYADNYLNPQTGEYYITTNYLLDNLAIQENKVKTEGEDVFDFMQSNTKNKLDINKTLTLDTGATNIAFERANETVVTSKFHTEEAKLMKKIWNDKLELYGSAVLGASYYRLNSADGNLDSADRIATLAGSRTGAKYNVSDNFGLVVEGQYNLTGEMAGNSEVIKNFRDTQYNGSRVLKTGFEWKF